MSPDAGTAAAAGERSFGVLELEGEACPWGLPSASVLGVLSEAEWPGEAPLDAARAFGLVVPRDLTPRRVLVVASAGGERALLVRGKISYREVAARDVLELPPGFSDADGRRAPWQIVLLAGDAKLLLLNPHTLFRDVPEAEKPLASASESPAHRGTPCSEP